MQSFCQRIGVVARHRINNLKSVDSAFRLSALEPNNAFISKAHIANYLESPIDYPIGSVSHLVSKFGTPSPARLHKQFILGKVGPPISQFAAVVPTFPIRCIPVANYSTESASKDTSLSGSEVAPRIKFKRLDKTAKHIMQILDKEALEEVKAQREIPDIKPGYIIQLKVEVPENKRRATLVKGIVIARRNCGLNTTIRLRRMVAGVGVESLLPLYSPNIKEIKVLEKKKVRRAKLYYLRDKLNPLRRK